MTEQQQTIDTVVVGMGLTGYSCACHLAAQGIDFVMVDTRTNPPMLDELYRLFPGVPLYTGGLNEEVLGSARRLLLSPGVSLHEPALQMAIAQGVKVIGDIELFCQLVTKPIIAVTGSNGKSTVVTLVAEMAREAGLQVGLGGNIGVPALDLLDGTDYDVYVLELSSFQLELVNSLNARAAVVLNVSADHMDRYNNLSQYAAAKTRIFAGSGAMIINRDDALVSAMALPNRRICGYTLHEPQASDYGVRQHTGKRWLAKGENLLLPIDAVKLAGDHNIANCLAALALGEQLGLDEAPMLAVLQRFAGLPHRCQWVADIHGVRWVNDSKGTNPGATCAAIQGLADQNNIVLIAGGDGKGADFSSLADVAQDCLRTAILIGRDGPLLKATLQDHVPVHEAGSLENAVNIAAGLAQKNDVVLLSPACASFDMFRDYQARGDAFIAAVRNLEAAK